MSKNAYIALCLGLFAGLFMLDLRVFRPRIERDLRDRTGQVLQAHGYDVQSTYFAGRDGVIRVLRSQPGKMKGNPLHLARNVYGVRDARVILEGPEEVPPTLRLERIGENIRLSGSVRTQAKRGEVEQSVQLAFPDFAIKNEIEIAERVSDPAYFSQVYPFFALLNSTAPHGAMTLDEKQIRLAGEVPNAVAREALESKARSMLPAGFQISFEIAAHVEAPPPPVVVAAPVATPEVPPTLVEPPSPEPRSLAKDLKRELETSILHFEFDSVRLAKDSTLLVEPLVEVARDLSGIEVLITGHADSKGSRAYNQTLSIRRAETIRQLFKNQGVQAEVKIRGAGETAPVASNRTPQGRALNRRVEFKVSGS